MAGVIEISSPCVSGLQHLLIPASHPHQQSHAIPTDVSCTLPPLTMNALAGCGMKATNNSRLSSLSGMPSPPSSDCSHSYTAQKQSPPTRESTISLPSRRITPPYWGTESWPSQLPPATTPSQNMSEQTAYDMSFGPLVIRQPSQRQLQQQPTYYTSTYASTAMPPPSSLLGAETGQTSSYPPPKCISTYPTLHRAVAPPGHEFVSVPYGDHFHSQTASSFAPAPGCLAWQPSAYPSSYIQPETWASEAQVYRRSRPTTILGSLPREACWRVFQHLEYADRLRLQSVNRFWAESLKALDRRIKAGPTDADFADMHSLVLQAENYSKHWSPSVAAESKTSRGRPSRANTRRSRKGTETSDDLDGNGKRDKDPVLVGNVGCYHCFTVRPPEYFAMKIEEEDEALVLDEDHYHRRPDDVPSDSDRRTGPAPRRYCLDCGIKKGYHRRGKYIETKAGNNHVVWVCCGAYYDYGLSNCPACGRGCPLTPVNKSSRNSRKRSSPMQPPQPPSRSRQRTSEGGPADPRQSVGHGHGYQYAQWGC